MLVSTSLSALNDNELLARLRELRHCEHETTLEILLHLNEVERRKLHLKLGYPSMFIYCTEHLRYSESSAGRRVQAARCVARFPQIAVLLERGDVNLMTLGLVASLLNDDTAGPMLEQIRGKTQREVEAIASAFRPPVRLRDRVRHVQIRVAAEVSAPILPAVDSPALPQQVSPPGPPAMNRAVHSQSGSEKAPNTAKTAPKLYIQFLADEALMRDYDETCALLSHKIPRPSFATVFGALLKDFVARHSSREKRARRDERSRKRSASSTRPSRRGGHRRAISAKTRDAVFVRDQGQCTYIGTNGHRCGERRPPPHRPRHAGRSQRNE